MGPHVGYIPLGAAPTFEVANFLLGLSASAGSFAALPATLRCGRSGRRSCSQRRVAGLSVGLGVGRIDARGVEPNNRVEVTLRVSVKNMCGLVVAAISHEQPTSAAEREAIKQAVGNNGHKEGDLLPRQAGKRLQK